MAKGAYIGIGGVAKKIKKGYIGIGGVAKKIKKGYIGIGGVARPFWSGGELTYHGRIYPGLASTTEGQPLATTVGDYALFYVMRTVTTYNSSLV